MKFTRLHSALLVIGLLNFFLSTLGASSALANPTCYEDDRKTVITDSSQNILSWIQNQDPNWHRIMVTGSVVKRLPDLTGHAHFLIDINGDHTADLEVIHQSDFGAITSIQPGMAVAVCGDFKYELMDGVKSFVHWTHCNPGTQQPNHQQGFVAVNGVVYGITAPQGEPACDPSKP